MGMNMQQAFAALKGVDSAYLNKHHWRIREICDEEGLGRDMLAKAIKDGQSPPKRSTKLLLRFTEKRQRLLGALADGPLTNGRAFSASQGWHETSAGGMLRSMAAEGLCRMINDEIDAPKYPAIYEITTRGMEFWQQIHALKYCHADRCRQVLSETNKTGYCKGHFRDYQESEE